MTQEEAGKVAYEAYRAALGGQCNDHGCEMLNWEDLPAEDQVAWVSAAAAVSKRYGAIY